MTGRSASQTPAHLHVPLALLFVVSEPLRTWHFNRSSHPFKAELSHYHPLLIRNIHTELLKHSMKITAGIISNLSEN